MCLLALLIAMLAAQRVLDFFHSFDPLRARLPLPEQDESQSTYATVRLGISIRAVAQDLHF
jgi:hypothetical protein